MRRYTYNEEGSDWRDPSILPDANAIRMSRQRAIAQQAEVDIDDTPDRQPDDYWVLPSNASEYDILGERRANLEEIRRKTDAYLVFNSRKFQVDIWGDRNSINQAKRLLDQIANPITEKLKVVRKTKKWGKAERELTDKERKREDRRQQKLIEQKSYTGIPTQPQPYNSYFPFKDKSIHLTKFSGEKESILNAIRAACKCFIWYDETLNSFKIAGQDEDDVRKASARLRNWYFKLCRKPQPATLHLLYQPTTAILAKFIKLPQKFVPCDLYVEPARFDDYRRIETVTHGHIESINPHVHSSRQQQHQQLNQQHPDLINFDDDSEGTSHNLPTVSNTDIIPDSLRNLNETNVEKMENALDLGLESLRLNDWEIKMDVIFGQLYLLDYPRRDPYYFFTMEVLAEKVFTNPKFVSKLAPCIGTSYDHVKELLEYLSFHGEEYADSPRTSFTIEALQQPNLPPNPTEFGRFNNNNNNGGSSRSNAPPPTAYIQPWLTTLKINTFTPDGFVGLWGCVTDSNTLVSINCANLQGNYSWQTRLQYARRLDTSTNTPHGQFVDKLRLSSNKRLIMTNVDLYRPHLIKQSTKWVYGWKKYIVEVEKEEMWDMSNMKDYSYKTTGGLPLDFSTINPDRVNYHVSMYRESWVNRFSDNTNLEIGEAPSWTPRSFLLGEDNENLHQLQLDAKDFADKLSARVPVYYDNISTSLV